MNVKSRIGQLVGESINAYNNKLKPIIEEVELREKYQSRIIECMIGEVDDNYIETPEVTESVFKLEYSKEGLVKLPNIKGKTILVDADGNETNTPGEGCRLVSVGEKEDDKLIISSKNRNLFDTSKFHVENGSTYGYIYLGEGEAYTLSVIDKDASIDMSNVYFGFTNNGIDSSSGYIWSMGNGSLFYKTLTHDKYKYFSFYPNNQETLNKITSRFNLQIEKGNMKTDYVESQSHKVEILLKEPLRRINNDIYDEIIDNKIIRRVGKLYVDGTNNELYNLRVANHQNTDILQGFDIGLKNNLTISQPLICNNRNYNNREIWVHQNVGTIVVIKIPKEELSSLDIVGLKEWLIKNPVTIFYKYVEPIIEELPNSIALQCFDDTTMYIENSIIPTVTYGYNALIPYKEELAKQREEVDNNVLDIETNIIPYLTEIEYNLNRMEGN